MKDTVKVIFWGIVGAMLLVGMFFGAVLQESYKLNPPTAEEVAR